MYRAQHRLEAAGPEATTEAERKRLDELRAQAAALHAQWSSASSLRRQAQRFVDDWQSTRAAFQRVSTKRGAQLITTIRSTPGFPARDHRQLAYALAGGWLATLTSDWLNKDTEGEW